VSRVEGTVMKPLKKVDSLGVRDVRAHPVWEYALDAETEKENDETSVRPVPKLPVSTLANRVVGTKVHLADGQLVWALLGCVDERSARSTQQFLHLRIWRAGRAFDLARYHDLDYARHGPKALARFLGMPIDCVFPISYDLRAYARGKGAALRGTVLKEPRERLNDDELMELALAETPKVPAPRPLKGANLAKKAKALIRRRGRLPDGSTVAEIVIKDNRTGRVY
jgi:hypothetical protein